ncbi:hypothetical protein JIQ42_07031 [Leishmania sp. Namibia]|uniref:hypothetical protein n=1 Tax=Leishmania sp. Namibia TaxID=2802991 RepID=UPI001B56B3FA|nr:hypothetical protein JIQ42_07031 [Leishmania sp. Namibia]
MDVFLHVVQTASASPVSASGLCDDRSQHASLSSPAAPSANSSSTSFTVEALRLSRSEARLGSGVANRWHVAPCSPAEEESTDGGERDAQMVFPMTPSARPPASQPASIPPSSVKLSAASVDITDPRGRRLPGSHTTSATADLLYGKLCHVREALAKAGDADGPPVSLAETIFFCGSRLGTRKDALYLTTLHRLLVEALLMANDRRLPSPSPLNLNVDISLVDYDEVWGAGDVLAAEVPKASADSTHEQRCQITWMPLARILKSAPGARSVMTAASHTTPARPTSLAEVSAKTLTSATSDVNVFQVAQLVRQRLQVWFDRIDSATSSFPSPPALPSPPAAADRLRHLDRNVVLFTMRLRSNASSSTPTWQARFRAAYFTLVLLPECGASPSHSATDVAAAAMDVSPRRASVALWREFEALSAFMRSLPPSRHRRRDGNQKSASSNENGRTSAATLQARMRAAALRRSRWLTIIARIHHPPTPPMGARGTETGEYGVDDVGGRFLESSTVRSFSWIGCISAAASHQRATRSTLAFLSRLQSPQPAPCGCLTSGKVRSPESAAGTPLTRHDRPHHENVSDKLEERNAPRAQEASSSSATSTTSPHSPSPSANVPRPYVSPRLHGVGATSIISSGKAGTAVASHLSLNDEHRTTTNPVAAHPLVSHAHHGADDRDASSKDAGYEPASLPTPVDALIASLRSYASVLEEEVQRLRRRLHRYEAASRGGRVSAGEPLPQWKECGSLSTSISVSAPHATSPHIYASLPQSVRVALDELRLDARFPPALQAKLGALTQRLASACAAAVQVRENSVADVSAAARQQYENSDGRDAYVAQLEAKAALYEQKLALMDYYVAPALVQCVDDLDQWQQYQRRRHPMRATLTETASISPPLHPTLLPE